MTIVQFVRSYTDQSTDHGFQFEFFCDRCGSGYQTPFVAASQNVVKDVLDAAGNLLGGVFYTMADMSERAHSVQWEKAHDEAFRNAVASIRPHFKQCGPCGQWVDTACWESGRNCCKSCAENLEALPEEKKTRKSKSPKNGGKPKTLACAACDAKIPGSAKFCPECGHRVEGPPVCPACGTEGSGKFCAECGEAL